jgi:hypothetical protein
VECKIKAQVLASEGLPDFVREDSLVTFVVLYRIIPLFQNLLALKKLQKNHLFEDFVTSYNPMGLALEYQYISGCIHSQASSILLLKDLTPLPFST